MELANEPLVIVVGWATVFALLASQRQGALDAELRQNANIASVLEEQTVRVIAAVDQAVLRLHDARVRGEVMAEDSQRFAESTGLSADILVQLSLVDERGRFVGSNLDPQGLKTGHVDLSAREHVQGHLHALDAGSAARERRSAGGLFVGRPVLGKVSSKWTIQLSRAIRDARGQLLGVVVASVNPDYFEDVYRNVALGSQGGVSLLGADGVLRARVIGGNRAGTGATISGQTQAGRERLAASGAWVGRSAFDQVERFIAYRRVSDYPLYVFVVTAVDEALAPWRATRNLLVSITALLCLAVAGIGLLFLDSVRKLENQHLALQASETEAKAANRAKTEFLAAISHELRTPLTSIRGFAELIEHRTDNPRFREQAMFIRKASEHLHALLSEILDLARVESGSMVFDVRPHPIADIVRAAIQQFAGKAAQRNLALLLDISEETPAQFPCDEVRIRQILDNLLSNAIKFTDQGSVNVIVSVRNKTLRIQVSDTGPGIAPHLQETIFEQFRQADARVSYQHGGTGLGLALSRSLARRMGGDLTVRSRVGQGARFLLAIPFRGTDAVMQVPVTGSVPDCA